GAIIDNDDFTVLQRGGEHPPQAQSELVGVVPYGNDHRDHRRTDLDGYYCWVRDAGQDRTHGFSSWHFRGKCRHGNNSSALVFDVQLVDWCLTTSRTK